MPTDSKDCPHCGTRIHMDETCPRCGLLAESQYYLNKQERATRAWYTAALKAGLYCAGEDVSTPDKWLAAQLKSYERLKIPPFDQDQTPLEEDICLHESQRTDQGAIVCNICGQTLTP